MVTLPQFGHRNFTAFSVGGIGLLQLEHIGVVTPAALIFRLLTMDTYYTYYIMFLTAEESNKITYYISLLFETIYYLVSRLNLRV